jgi:hypothetical protein
MFFLFLRVHSVVDGYLENEEFESFPSLVKGPTIEISQTMSARLIDERLGCLSEHFFNSEGESDNNVLHDDLFEGKHWQCEMQNDDDDNN